MFSYKVRPGLQLSALLSVLLLAGVQGSSAIFVTTTQYRFVGQCGDCTGTGVGVLTLGNYTPGNPLLNGNFISFTYTSNLLNFTLQQSDQPNLSGLLPASLPAAASVTIGSIAFQSGAGGAWCAGQGCAADFGSTSTWSAVSTGTTGVPALSPAATIGLALMLALFGALLLKQVRGRIAA